MSDELSDLIRWSRFDPSIEFDPVATLRTESSPWHYSDIDAHNDRARRYWNKYWSEHRDVAHIHPAGVYHPDYSGPDRDENVNRAKMGILAYTRKQRMDKEEAERERKQDEAARAAMVEKAKSNAIERDSEGNEIGDDIWPSPDEPFPYAGGEWSRDLNADGTIHHFQRDCPHCSTGESHNCPYCGGTGAQRIGRGGRPLSKRELDQYWRDCE